MSTTSYNELITKTFRDEAIRSVMMIDDDFLPYDELFNSVASLSDKEKIGPKKAAEIHKFFQTKRIVCDVDKGTDHIDIEKVRKCDLVILDYHLAHEDPRKSIELIEKLSKTEHMNLVVVYTRENLEVTWLEITACLRGTDFGDVTFPGSPDTQAFWDLKTEDSSSIPNDWIEKISNKDIANYAIKGDGLKETIAWFGPNLAPHGKTILKAMCERRLSEMNVTKSPRSGAVFSGENDAQKWLQIGTVFVVLHQKTSAENVKEPEEIWNSIDRALISWQPSYYRLLISEMQNKLENETFPFSTNLAQDVEGQAAWLYEILAKRIPNEREVAINRLFDRLTDELKKKLFENKQLRQLVDDTFNALTQSHDKEECDLLQFSANHVGIDFIKAATKKLKSDVGHALNSALCMRDFDGEYITSGTILYDNVDRTKWYLCVAPACETVPYQDTGHLAKKLRPHRLMKMLVLQNATIDDALIVATDSNHIFIKGPLGERKAFTVLNTQSGQPVIDYVLVQNHDTSTKMISTEGITVSFLALGEHDGFKPEPRKLIPIAQLRDIYTARYQAIASHHIGRVGVDFVKFA